MQGEKPLNRLTVTSAAWGPGPEPRRAQAKKHLLCLVVVSVKARERELSNFVKIDEQWECCTLENARLRRRHVDTEGGRRVDTYGRGSSRRTVSA